MRSYNQTEREWYDVSRFQVDPDEVVGQARDFLENLEVNHYAFMAVIKGKKSQRLYVDDPRWPLKSLASMLNDERIRQEVDGGAYTFTVPIQKYLVACSYVISACSCMVLVVFAFMMLLAYIVTS